MPRRRRTKWSVASFCMSVCGELYKKKKENGSELFLIVVKNEERQDEKKKNTFNNFTTHCSRKVCDRPRAHRRRRSDAVDQVGCLPCLGFWPWRSRWCLTAQHPG